MAKIWRMDIQETEDRISCMAYGAEGVVAIDLTRESARELADKLRAALTADLMPLIEKHLDG